jgi:CTP:molybdopterin cytidylyltransferase MocA
MPSTALTEALRQLSQAQEMEPLLRHAKEAGREVVIEVFQSRDGQPLLIHTALLPDTAA